MYVSRDRLRHIKRFAEADVAFVCVNLHPQHVGKLGEIDGVDGGDFHERSCASDDRMALEYSQEMRFDKFFRALMKSSNAALSHAVSVTTLGSCL